MRDSACHNMIHGSSLTHMPLCPQNKAPDALNLRTFDDNSAKFDLQGQPGARCQDFLRTPHCMHIRIKLLQPKTQPLASVSDGDRVTDLDKQGELDVSLGLAMA